MKKITAGFAGIVLALSLTACGSGNSQPDTVVETVTASPEASSFDSQFAELIRDNTDAFDAASDEEIADAGKGVCGIWEAGGDITDVIGAVIDSGVDPEDGGFLAGAGTQAYCPEYADQIPGSNA